MSQVLQWTQLAALIFSFSVTARIFRHFVDSCGTKILAGVAVFLDTFCGADIGVGDVEMAGLVFFVARAGVVDVGQAIESEFAVAFEAFGGGAAVDFFVVLVASVDVHGIDQAAAAGDLLEAVEEEAAEAGRVGRIGENCGLAQSSFLM